MANQTNASGGSGAARGSLGDTIGPMRKLAEDLSKIYVERHEYRDATTADFKDRDRGWYDSATRELSGLGYRHLGDIVNETVARAAGLVVVLRRFVSQDGANMAAIYQFVPPIRLGGAGADLRVCDVESEFSDGSFLQERNARAAGDEDEDDEPDQTLGWLQGAMAEDFGTAGEIADARFEDGGDWINLLAVHSAGSSMQWSDAGDLYFLIRRSALKAHDFANVLAAACSS